MVPTLLNEIGNWLDVFGDTLNRWEATLEQTQAAYVNGDYQSIASLSESGESIHQQIHQCKRDRHDLLRRAAAMGYFVHSLRELSLQMDDRWPALWTHRIHALEQQLARVQQLSMSLWVHAFQSKSFVSDILMLLATGKSQSATYAPHDVHTHEGGYLVDEAA